MSKAGTNGMSPSRQNKTNPQAVSAQTAVVESLKDIRVINVLLLAAAFAMFVGYLAMTTTTATKGFSLKGLEQKISALEEQKRKAGIEMVSSQSMATMQTQVQGLGLVPVTKIDYVNAGGTVALR